MAAVLVLFIMLFHEAHTQYFKWDEAGSSYSLFDVSCWVNCPVCLHVYAVVLDVMRKDNVSELKYAHSEFINRQMNRPPPLSHPHLCPSLHLLVTKVCAVFSSPFHRRASMLDFYFDHSEERPLEAFEDIFASYESKK